MNKTSIQWWFWGLAGAILVPVILLALDYFVRPHLPPGIYRPAVDGIFLAFAGGIGLVAVPALPVWPWIRMVLWFVYIPVFIWAVRTCAPWVPLG